MDRDDTSRTSEPLLSFFSPEHLKEPALTADVLRVLVLANEEARKLNHKRTGPEHILLGLIQEGSEASQALQSVGLTYETAKEFVIGRADFVKIEPKRRPMLSKLLDVILVMFRKRPFSNDAWLLMHDSIEEAHNLHSHETTSEHILLALLNQTDADAENNLHSFGIDSEALRDLIRKRQKQEREKEGREKEERDKEDRDKAKLENEAPEDETRGKETPHSDEKHNDDRRKEDRRKDDRHSNRRTDEREAG